MGRGQHPLSAQLYQRLTMNPAHVIGKEPQGVMAGFAMDHPAAAGLAGLSENGNGIDIQGLEPKTG